MCVCWTQSTKTSISIERLQKKTAWNRSTGTVSNLYIKSSYRLLAINVYFLSYYFFLFFFFIFFSQRSNSSYSARMFFFYLCDYGHIYLFWFCRFLVLFHSSLFPNVSFLYSSTMPNYYYYWSWVLNIITRERKHSLESKQIVVVFRIEHSHNNLCYSWH